MAAIAAPYARMAAAWGPMAERFAAYELVLPGAPSFVCQAELCGAHCCKAFSVSLGEAERVRMQAVSGFVPVQFLECEDGAPVTLPLAHPYLLGRKDGACALLGDSLGCTQYHGRPNACRLYPHFVVFIDEAARRPVQPDGLAARSAVEAEIVAEGPAGPVPLLVRHRECPGFTGPPLPAGAWAALFRETAALQFEFV